MSEFQVKSFKYGLDTRRDTLTSVAGTLVVCENGAINPGGEIDKRNAFTLYTTVAVLDNNGAQGTFGIEVTSAGLVVFGSARDYDDVYVSGTAVASVAVSGIGVGATFNITAVNGAITVAAVNAGGAGYVVGDILSLVTARGTEARLTVATAPAGVLATVTITNNGNEQAEPFLVSALSGVTYQQLKHPTLVNDSAEDYNALYHRMTSVVFSENFNGLAFACAKFSDLRRYLYDDGTLIQNSSNGLALENRVAVADLAVDLVRNLGPIGYNTEVNVDEFAVAQNGSVIVKSPPGDYFKPIPSETSVLGYIGEKQIAQNGASVSAVKAVASFQVTGGAGTFTLLAPNQASAITPTIDLCGGAVATLGTNTLTADAIVQAVNDFTVAHGYSAQTNGINSVFVYAPENYDLVLGLDLTVNVTGAATTGAAGASPTSLAAIIDPNPAENTLVVIGRRVATLVTVTASVITVGGTGPYTFVWSAVSGAALVGIVSGGGTSTMTFGSMLFNATAEAVYKCVVTDSLAATTTAFVNIKLAFFNFPQP